MFPAHAGMNRRSMWVDVFGHYVPRSCGDEPVDHLKILKIGICSPLMRG